MSLSAAAGSSGDPLVYGDEVVKEHFSAAKNDMDKEGAHTTMEQLDLLQTYSWLLDAHGLSMLKEWSAAKILAHKGGIKRFMQHVAPAANSKGPIKKLKKGGMADILVKMSL